MHAAAGGAGLANPTALRRARPGRSARAFSLLEVTLAIALLAFVAIAMTGTVTLISRLRADDRQRAGGYELANRLIVMYLDDDTSINSLGKTVEYLGFRYKWELDEDTVTMRVKPTEATARVEQTLGYNRFKRITFRIFAVDEAKSQNGRFAVAGDQVASLSRLYDPMAIMSRNPDSWDYTVTGKPGGLTDFITRITAGAAARAAQPQPAPATGGAPK
ncbi:MAG: hypothetical protein KF745_07120 [Phycisphaeraceae bacterium]|nr:hypothetical protein [Phycisphaeraceae bacterium]